MANKSILKRIYDGFYVKIFPDYRRELSKATMGCKSILDVGCGSDSPIQTFSKDIHCVGVDLFQPSIDKSKEKNIHDEYHKINILDIGKNFGENSFDCVLASDVIEHITKEDGLKLISMMEKIARKKVIIYTPTGFYPQSEYDNNPLQEHKSGWEVKEMRDKGYKVIGIHGWRPLRKEEDRGEIRYKPKYLWMVISDLTQLITKHFPNQSLQILCTKEMRKNEMG